VFNAELVGGEKANIQLCYVVYYNHTASQLEFSVRFAYTPPKSVMFVRVFILLHTASLFFNCIS